MMVTSCRIVLHRLGRLAGVVARGIHVGNLASQLLAHFHPDDLDRHVKPEIRLRAGPRDLVF